MIDIDKVLAIFKIKSSEIYRYLSKLEGFYFEILTKLSKDEKDMK